MSDVFGRTEAVVRYEHSPAFAIAIAGTAHDETERAMYHVRLSSGPRALAFKKATPKKTLDDGDAPIMAALELAPLPLGYISNGLLYADVIDRLPARTKARLYRLVKGGHVRVVETWTPTPQYWLAVVSDGFARGG